VCVGGWVGVCVRACVRACMCMCLCVLCVCGDVGVGVCVRACVRACVRKVSSLLPLSLSLSLPLCVCTCVCVCIRTLELVPVGYSGMERTRSAAHARLSYILLLLPKSDGPKYTFHKNTISAR
jgi:hypothetical protein